MSNGARLLAPLVRNAPRQTLYLRADHPRFYRCGWLKECDLPIVVEHTKELRLGQVAHWWPVNPLPARVVPANIGRQRHDDQCEYRQGHGDTVSGSARRS